MKTKLKDRGRWLPEKSLLFINDYPEYEMCCFKRKMSVPKRLIDSKAWYPLSFLLEITVMGIEDKNTKNSIKSKNYPKSKTLRELEKLDID